MPRSKTPPLAEAGLHIDEVVRRLGIPARTIRFYKESGVFTPPPFRGPGTRYLRAHVERLVAIRDLRKLGMGYAAIRAKLDAPAPPAGATPVVGAERWDRVVLLPGLELFVRADAGEVLTRLAAEIQARYAVVPSSS